MSRMFIFREELLNAIEKVEKYYGSIDKDQKFYAGVQIGLERLKHELGYDKMIPRKSVLKQKEE